MDPRDTPRRSNRGCGCLELGACRGRDSPDSAPPRELAAADLGAQMTGGNGVEGKLEKLLCTIESERLAEIGRVQRVAKEDVEELSGDAPGLLAITRN